MSARHWTSPAVVKSDGFPLVNFFHRAVLLLRRTRLSFDYIIMLLV